MKCQSANKLKTPAKVSWAFKMVSQFGSLDYTIMGKTAGWQLSRRQSLTPFTRRVSHKHSLPKKLAVHRVLYPSMLTESWVEGKSVEEKDAQSSERTVALWGLSSKIDSRIWVNFTRNGLRLGSRHQEPPHTDVSRNLTTVVFHLETKVLESGGRVEKLIAQVAWSPVLSFHSLWWFGVQCHLLVLVHCVFWKPMSLDPFTKKCWSTSLKMQISFSSRNWHLSTLPKTPKFG